MSASDSPSRPESSRRFTALLTATTVALIAGGSLWQLAPENAGLLAPATFVREAQAHVLPALGQSAGEILHHSAALAHGWAASAVALTGQWDARVLSLAALVLAGGGLATWLLALGRFLAPTRLTLAALAGLALTLLAARNDHGTGAQALAYAWFWLTLIQLSLTASGKSARSATFGWLVGALNLLASSLGFAAALAQLVRDLRERAHASRIVASAGLVVAGAIVTLTRPHGTSDALPALSFPFTSGLLAVFVWAPSGILLWRWRRRASEAVNLLAPLALSFVGGTLVALAAGVELAQTWWSLGLLINVAAIAVLLPPGAGRRWPAFCGAVVWFVAVTNALIQPLTRPEPGRYEPAAASVDDLARPAAEALAAGPELRAVLPPPWRAPLSLREARTDDAFGSAKPTGLDAPERLPVFTSWNETAGAAAEGEFRSELLTSPAAVLQLRVAGTLRPPETELALVTASGREIAPLETGFVVGNRWKRLNFPAPDEPFRVVARDRSATQWLAFTAPVEVSRIGWLVAKIARAWIWWIVGGAIGIVAVVWSGRAAWSLSLTSSEWRLLPWLALFAYGLFFFPHVDNTAAPNDSGGYLNLAKTFSHGRVAEEIKTPGLDLPAARNLDLYIPSTARVSPDGRMAPEYPLGLGLLIAAVATVTSFENATTWVLWLHLLGGVVITWRAARVFGLSDAWAWLAAGIIALSSVYLFQTLQPQTDGPSVLWVTAAVAFAWSSRERAWHVFLAGLATSMAVLMRPANLLCVLPVFICVWDRPRELRNLVLSGLPAAAWLMWFNLRLYGHPLMTGYGDVHDWWGLRFVVPTLIAYVQWLPLMFTPVVVAAFAAPWVGGFAPRARTVLALWVGGFLVFYLAYWCAWDNWFAMRFVLPGLPAAIILGLHACRAGLARMRCEIFPADPARAAWWPGAMATVLVLAFVASDIVRRDVLYWVRASRAHRVAVDWLREHAPADAIVFGRQASNAVWHYTDFQLVRPDNDTVRAPDFLPRLARTGRPIYSINQHWERKDYEWGQGKGDGLPDLPGDWERLAVLWEGEYVIWRWHPPKTARR